MTGYKHTQFANAIVWPLGIAAVVVAICGIAEQSAFPGMIVLPVLALVIAIFFRLTITVEDDRLRVAFGPGVVAKSVPTREIASCEPVRIKWWEGWGIHLSRFGWLYNVSGWNAVAIRLRDGKRFAVGTDQPNELADAIRRCASAK